MRKPRIQQRYQIDRDGMRVRVGDTVEFHLDPEKPWKRPSRGVVTRWDGQCVAVVRYTGKGYGDPGPHYFALGAHEFSLVKQGQITERVIMIPALRIQNGGGA